MIKQALFTVFLVFLTVFMMLDHAFAEHPEPVVAIHVSELTKALETMPAKPPTPPAGPDTTGYEWAYTSWRYFVAYESLQEALRSDGTPFVELSDADIISGRLLYADGSPRYPLVISLMAEAISDAEIAPLKSYVNGGGFLLIGASAFTRSPDGTMRGDFALADEMGVHAVAPGLDNWGENMEFTKILDHPLLSGIPEGTLRWRMPLTADEIPVVGFDYDFFVHGNHYLWQVKVSDATILARGSSPPLLTVKNYGKGTFIYHGVFQPLIGHGGFDSGMYAYLIYRNAIALAFQSASLPLIRLSPWRYPYDAAFIVRHDLENFADLIRSIEPSAAFESSLGAKGDYYFCTGTLRDHMADKADVVNSLRRAVSDYGASIGPHNGGLQNPADPSLDPLAYDYWHWGPDEVLDLRPLGYADGKAYAEASLSKSFEDIAGWLTGVDNGRAGCGAAGNCPRLWVSPKFNSTREDSYNLLENLGTFAVGEQKIGPFPHWTISTRTPGKRYYHLTLPVSEWYAGSEALQSLDDYTSSSSMRAAVDFYYDLGALINLYGHMASAAGNIQGECVSYCLTKPRIWSTNTVGVADWWRSRANARVTPGYSRIGDTAVARATITGAADGDTAVEIAMPDRDGQAAGNLQVFLNGSPATFDDYRITSQGVKIRVGTSVTDLEVHSTMVPILKTVVLQPSSLIGGSSSTGTVTLANPAPTGGVEVTLSSSNTSVASVPALVTVEDGETSATFTIITHPVTVATQATISAAIGEAVQSTPLLINPASPPPSFSIWNNSAVPTVAADPDVAAGEVGVKFRSDVDGYVTGIRFYKSSTNTGTHTGSLWTAGGTLLASATFINETLSGWQQASFATPVAITANTVYIASYHFNVGHYSCDTGYFAAGVDNGPLHALADGVSGENGVGTYGSTTTFPQYGWNKSNYWVDVVFSPGEGPALPAVVSVSPTDGSSAVNTNAVIKVIFSKPMDAATINTATFALRDGAVLPVSAAVHYDSTTATASLTPEASLSESTTYTATVAGGPAGVKDTAGNPLLTDRSWSFTTAPNQPSTSSSLWSDSFIPAVLAEPDSNAVEVGVKFKSDVAGFVTALRFYKASGNTGPHVGRCWSENGSLLASVTFTNETDTGWQEVQLPNPVAITANTVYIASYHTGVGRYSVNQNYFTGSAFTNPPLRALADGENGGNGVYRYGSGGFPNQTWNGSNYWVDVVFSPLE